ncbi:uncharacterized protein GGS22DRAFT_180551 [Annulohypoxylon maeteangense]|uniref:uncharacterized protein n=1 Tax=Annulohypoxylon maeteangense TaxID=1927788 RepID=UPI00200870B9|nr:uncharacterized protein GGS22DRAFT_180551 [Annulohypoxylon maeteangense]KAI0883433.1 hypothetical protein GGS22DRAFT_180551 [Annulohypoxylon maeteangense]
MFSTMPVYSFNKESQQTAARSPPETRRPSTACSPTAPIFQLQNGLGEFLEPAIDGPPSPEHLRALNNEMKRNSNTDRHLSEGTSSGASSRLSATSDRRSWNQSMESLSLSRNPSQRSASSGVPTRERTDSVQFFSKGMFSRSRGRLRRESSDQSSSNSSLDASEMPIDALPKDQPFISSVFARRRALRGETSAPAPQKKLQISGPYNFQHLTHTKKDSVPQIDRTNHLELVSEFSGMRPRRPTNASLSGAQQAESQFTAFPSETFYHQEDPSAGLYVDGAQSRDKALPPSPPPPPPSTRYAKRSQSQDKIRYAPPRPPRSPPFDSGVTSPIPPPPRTSSRVSVRHGRYDSLTMARIAATTLAERPATTTGFRKPEPFAPTSPKEVSPKGYSPKGLRPPPPPRATPMVESVEEETESEMFPRAISTPDDAAWPLANSISSLPDVPEEEEHHALSRPSRMSVASNHSSLRGSISVPLLRQLSMTQSHQRPPSNASDTLGLFNAQRLMRTGTGDEYFADDMDRDNWEDDIDYCYEHEAEADCDYAWERPSCDIARGVEAETVITFTGPFGGSLACELLSPGNSDVPALSPASQTSNTERHEVITPTNLPVTSNFSLPRRESSAQLLRVHKRTQSPETNFKESQGFSLSPSLLIPNDYHQQMLRYEREELQDSEDEDFLIQGNTFDDQPIITFGKANNIRSSASTTNSTLSEHSMTSSRHKSTNSTSTAYTRWTGSSTSSWAARDPSQPIIQKAINDNVLPVITSPTAVVAPTSFEEMSPKQEKPAEKHGRTQSHAGLLMRSNYDAAPPVDQKQPAKESKEPIRTRRRARTTSRSHASPQFALFPAVTSHGNRI